MYFKYAIVVFSLSLLGCAVKSPSRGPSGIFYEKKAPYDIPSPGPNCLPESQWLKDYNSIRIEDFNWGDVSLAFDQKPITIGSSFESDLENDAFIKEFYRLYDRIDPENPGSVYKTLKCRLSPRSDKISMRPRISVSDGFYPPSEAVKRLKESPIIHPVSIRIGSKQRILGVKAGKVPRSVFWKGSESNAFTVSIENEKSLNGKDPIGGYNIVCKGKVDRRPKSLSDNAQWPERAKDLLYVLNRVYGICVKRPSNSIINVDPVDFEKSNSVR